MSRCIQVLIAVFAIVFCLCSCTYDKATRHMLSVNFEEGTDITSVNDIALYLFDNNSLFVDSFSIGVNASLELAYPQYSMMHAVAFANARANRLSLPVINVGDALENVFAQLPLNERNGKYVVSIPYDLFYAYSKIDLSGSASQKDAYIENSSMVLKRKLCYIKVDLVNLQAVNSSGIADYSIYIGQASSALKFNGTYAEPLACYNPQLSTSGASTYSTPIFYSFPSNLHSPNYLEVYNGNTLIYQVDSNSNPSLKWEEGKVTEIKVYFSAGSTVLVTNVFRIKDWVEENQTVPF